MLENYKNMNEYTDSYNEKRRVSIVLDQKGNYR